MSLADPSNSGSGKSTLLSVLAHRRAPAMSKDSNIKFDGMPFNGDFVRRNSAYVEQEDALIVSLTVRETLMFAAQLSLPHLSDRAKHTDRVEFLLQAFGLREQADCLIGTAIKKGISGGQKRRVSVASKLITEPKIVFLDEPTSGLDSAAALEVMMYLQNIARETKVSGGAN